MSQLRPLLSVVEQYRLDLQTLASLRQELLNLSVLLTSIQDEIGAYDYEELQQRVLMLETRLHSCMNKLGTCRRLGSSHRRCCPSSLSPSFIGTLGLNNYISPSILGGALIHRGITPSKKEPQFPTMPIKNGPSCPDSILPIGPPNSVTHM